MALMLEVMPKTPQFDRVRAVQWEDGQLKLLDQRGLPGQCDYIIIEHCGAAAQAIADMVVRGAPAIGITAAYAVVLAARERYRQSPEAWQTLVHQDLDALIAARPTAVNLAWAVKKMRGLLGDLSGDPVAPLLEVAQQIHVADIAANQHMGKLGAALIARGSSVLTHCNAGSLATGGYGTALGVIRAAVAAGKIDEVYADETRPWLQGARLTAWELEEDGIPVTLVADGAAAYLMSKQKIQWVIVGADRIAANGDVANKIGTYSVAVAARHHKIRTMVVAPTSTVDLETTRGEDIPVEIRPEAEILDFAGARLAARGAKAWNPVFDVTPAELVDVIVTEKGVVENPDRAKIAAMMLS